MQGKGLWHGSTDSKPVLCFCPTCSAACNRMFIPSEGPQYHSVSCDKWIVQPPAVIRLQNPQKVQVLPQREEALFFKEPISATIKFFERKESIRAKILSMYEGLKLSILECIEACKNGKLQELEFMSQKLESFRSIILEGASLAECKKGKESQEQRRIASIAINSLINSPKFVLPAFKNIQFFNTADFMQMTANLKQQIRNLGSCILKDIEIEGGFEGLQYEDMVNVELMLYKNRQTEEESEKDKKERDKDLGPDPLTALVTWQESDYFTERSKRITDIRCPLCQFHFEAGWVFSVGKPKSAYYDVIVKHLLSNHLLFLALCFSHRISKNSIKELPVSQLIHLMQKYNYDQMDIFDAANTKGLRFEPNPRCLTILLTPQNLKVDDFEYSYCMANSPEEAAYKIILLIEEVSMKLGKTIRLFNFKRNYYNLFSTIVSKYSLNVHLEEKYQPHIKGSKLEKTK